MGGLEIHRVLDMVSLEAYVLRVFLAYAHVLYREFLFSYADYEVVSLASVRLMPQRATASEAEPGICAA